MPIQATNAAFWLGSLSFLLALGVLFYDVASLSTGFRRRRIGVGDYLAILSALFYYSLILLLFALKTGIHPFSLYCSALAFYIAASRLSARREKIEVVWSILLSISTLAFIYTSIASIQGGFFEYDPRGENVLSVLAPLSLSIAVIIPLYTLIHPLKKISRLLWLLTPIAGVSLAATIILDLWSLTGTGFTGLWLGLAPHSLLVSSYLFFLAILYKSNVEIMDYFSTKITSFILLLLFSLFFIGILPTPLYVIRVTADIHVYSAFSVASLLLLLAYSYRLYRETSITISGRNGISIGVIALIFSLYLVALYPAFRAYFYTSPGFSLLDLIVFSPVAAYLFRRNSQEKIVSLGFRRLQRALHIAVLALVLTYTVALLLFPESQREELRVLSVEPGKDSIASPPSILVAHGFFLLYGAVKKYPPAIKALLYNVSREEASKRLATIEEIRTLFFEKLGVNDTLNISQISMPSRMPSLILWLGLGEEKLAAVINSTNLFSCRPIIRPYSKIYSIAGVKSIAVQELDPSTSEAQKIYRLYLWAISRPENSNGLSLLYSIYAAEAFSWCITRSLSKTISLIRASINSSSLPVEYLQLEVRINRYIALIFSSLLLLFPLLYIAYRDFRLSGYKQVET